MKHIVHLSFGSSTINGELILKFQGESVRLTRLGSDHDLDLMIQWIKQYSGLCDVMAFSQLPPSFRLGAKTFHHQTHGKIIEALGSQAFTMGFQIQGLYGTWALEHCLKTGAVNFQNTPVTMLSGIWQQEVKQTLAAKSSQIYFLDPWSLLGIKAAIHGVKNFDLWASLSIPALTSLKPQWVKNHRIPLDKSQFPWIKPALDSEIFIGCSSLLGKIDSHILKNKTIFTDEMTPETEEFFRSAEVYNAYASRFILSDTSLKSCEVEALALLDKISEPSYQERGHKVPTLQMAELVEFVDRLGLKPQMDVLHEDRQKPLRKFAFVIHPLSQDYLFIHPTTSSLKAMPKLLKNQMEKWINLLPGVSYGTISGIQSTSTGVHAEGLIYTLFGTPRQLLNSDPEMIYRQLVKVAEHAAKQGAQIIGLGAFTKIVGDAGVTVAARSPIPVTTGNSLSAAATLWAARDACSKLGFVKFDKKKSPITEGRAMVIGATGSIGKACAKILAKLFTEVILTATNATKLFQLKEEILEESPDTTIHVTTQPSKFAADCELIVISTSAVAGGVLDLMAVKPGCVICDVSRPLTYKPSEATQRPDVLIIESGEIELPGQIKLDCDIGLPDSIVYACLAETAILALEGRYETYTLSRDIATNKVLEIYKMTKKHGGRLAAIRGPQGIITDMDIELCREHALKKLASKQPVSIQETPGTLGPEISQGKQSQGTKLTKQGEDNARAESPKGKTSRKARQVRKVAPPQTP